MPEQLLFVALAGHGHLNPLLPLVAELSERGHRVDFATAPEHAADVTAAGADWVELPPMEPFIPSPDMGPDIVVGWLRHYFAAMCATYPVLRERCRTHRPDAICYDTTNWPARTVAREFGVPAVRCFPHLATNDTFSLDDRVTAGLGPDNPGMAELAADCAEFAERYGVQLTVADTMDSASERQNLVFVPREFQPGGGSFDDRFHFVGPSTGRREQAEPWLPDDPELPLVYVSLGSVATGGADFYRTCVDAFADGSRQLAMTIGDTDPKELGTLPPHVEVRARFPQPSVLRHAAAFVTHAGMGSTMEALTHGVGMLAVPGTPEQAANAERVRELGLGTVADAGALTADSLRAAVEELMSDEATRQRLADMRKAIERAGGAARAADVVEGCVR